MDLHSSELTWRDENLSGSITVSACKTEGSLEQKTDRSVDVRYVSLYYFEDQKVPVSRVRATHANLQKAVSQSNVHFLPLDPNQVQVEYKKISVTSLTGAQPVVQAAELGGVVSGMLNVYFAASYGGILGQAEVKGNTIYCNTMGNEESDSTSQTLVNEVAHSLDLPRTFSDNANDIAHVFTDVPENIRPNYATELFQDDNGSWCQRDHTDNDRFNSPTESCMNIMDYGVDGLNTPEHEPTDAQLNRLESLLDQLVDLDLHFKHNIAKHKVVNMAQVTDLREPSDAAIKPPTEAAYMEAPMKAACMEGPTKDACLKDLTEDATPDVDQIQDAPKVAQAQDVISPPLIEEPKLNTAWTDLDFQDLEAKIKRNKVHNIQATEYMPTASTAQILDAMEMPPKLCANLMHRQSS